MYFAAWLDYLRREEQLTRERAEAAIKLSTEQGFSYWLAWETTVRGCALAEEASLQGRQIQREEGVAQIRQGLAALQATGTKLGQLYIRALLATYGGTEQTEKGLVVLDAALALVNTNCERVWEAELYRLKGELTLQSRQVESKSKTSLGQVEGTFAVLSPQSLTPNPQGEAEAEVCFWKAIEIARKQQAKSLELRATRSLSQLWQQQGKNDEARQLLAGIYGWFTEGFDTADLREAKALLNELGE
jgi:predicted ATPase